ncbi:MAG: hypothetical protein MK212_21815 [Saprospiraceae bacterium]|nr:hypothetical protein [Saprospiraceae bacterium]
MKFKSIIILSLASLLCLTYACTNEIEEFSGVDMSYAPLVPGTYIDYQVDSIIFSLDIQGDTFTHYVREEIDSMDYDNLGYPYYRLNRYERADTSLPWSLKYVWVMQHVNNQLHRVERNLRYINMTFPAELDITWDGLVFLRQDTVVPYTYTTTGNELIPRETINQFKDWDEFAYTAIDEPMSFNNLSFDNTLTINQVDKINNIERRYATEIYAKDIGLIYKEMQILDTQCSDSTAFPNGILDCINVPWLEKAERGFVLKQTVLGYGTN